MQIVEVRSVDGRGDKWNCTSVLELTSNVSDSSRQPVSSSTAIKS